MEELCRRGKTILFTPAALKVEINRFGGKSRINCGGCFLRLQFMKEVEPWGLRNDMYKLR